MTKSDLHYLKDLFDRASYSPILEHGSGEVIIYAREYRALEEVVKEAEKEAEADERD